MKKSVICFALMSVTVSCSVSATDQGHFPFLVVRPEFPDLDMPPLLEIPEIVYTEEEQQQVRQNLIGRYEGILNNEEIGQFARIAENDIFETRDGNVRAVSDYTLNFHIDRGPSITFERNNYDYEFILEFIDNSRTRVNGFVFHREDGSVIRFRKLENNEYNEHDEF